MFAIRCARPAAIALSANASRAAARSQQANGYATLREIEGRLKSIKNIEKITKTMKIVASTKLGKAQRAMEETRIYGETADDVYQKAETIQAAKEEVEVTEESGTASKLVIVSSSDKGLCGGIHSQLSKRVKNQANEGDKFDLAVIGDKSRTQLQRALPQALKLSYSGIGKEVPTFAEAQAITDDILNSGGRGYKQIEIVYNQFKTSISFETTSTSVYTPEVFAKSPGFSKYEIEDEVLNDLFEFNLANIVYWALVEGHACEISARRSAMDNASKNAGDMISRYSILYNRTRQAVITNELVDIITGASSLE